MPPAEFEPETPASDRPQILALDRSVTGIVKEFDLGTVQPVASLYTDWAVAACSPIWTRSWLYALQIQ